jgi:DNA repair protein RadC
MADADPAQDQKGHRARLRARLLAPRGGDALLEHELVEYLLALAMPRIDTKPMAKALIREFGTLGGLFAADAESLRRVDGIGDAGAAAIRIVAAATTRVLRDAVAQRPVLASWQALLDYLRADMAHAAVERVRVLHLNTRNMLIRDELLSEGTIDEAAVHVREVIRRALDLGSASLILVHNHPSGDPAPSRADIDLTRAIIEAGKPLRIAVHDHLIIGTQGHVSLRAKGVI